MSYIFNPQSKPSLPVKGTDKLFPVHRIYCVGRNYADHAVEMGHDPNREEPFFFQKNSDNIIQSGDPFPYPDLSENVQHEIELVVALDKGGKNISVENTLDHIFGYAVGLDMTRRDLQGEMKKTGRPWEIGKAFDHSAPCSEIAPAKDIGHPQAGAIWLKVNGETRQSGDLAQMIWKIPEIIAHLSRFFTLVPGDLIFTGTPSGVGPVVRGDVLHGSVDDVAQITTTVV